MATKNGFRIEKRISIQQNSVASTNQGEVRNDGTNLLLRDGTSEKIIQTQGVTGLFTQVGVTGIVGVTGLFQGLGSSAIAAGSYSGVTGLINNIGATNITGALFSGTTSIIDNIGATSINAALFSGTTSTINNVGATSINANSINSNLYTGTTATIAQIGVTKIIGVTGQFNAFGASTGRFDTLNAATFNTEQFGATLITGYSGAIYNLGVTNLAFAKAIGTTAQVNNIGATAIRANNITAEEVNLFSNSVSTKVVGHTAAVAQTYYGTSGYGSPNQVLTLGTTQQLVWADPQANARINYIRATDAEDNTGGLTGWTVGVAGVTFAINGVSALIGTKSFELSKGAINASGAFVAYPFTIDQQFVGKNLYWTGYLKTFGNYVVDDLGFFVWDNAAGTTTAISGSVVDGKFNFRCPMGTTLQYEARIGVKSASSATYAMLLDYVRMSPETVVDQAIITYLGTYTPTVTNLGTGTGTCSAEYSRSGENAKITIAFLKDGNNGSGASIVYFSLPAGLTLNSRILASNKIPVGSFTTSDTTLGAVSLSSSANGNGIFGYQPNAGLRGSDYLANKSYYLTIEVPILEWANQSAVLSTTEMMNQTTILSATSTPFPLNTAGYASVEWTQATGNSVSLPPGKWELNGSFALEKTSVTAYTNIWFRWASANGDNTGSTPAVITSTGLQLIAGNGDIYLKSSDFDDTWSNVSTIIVNNPTSSNITVYLVGRITFTGSASASDTVQYYITAKKLPDFSVYSVYGNYERYESVLASDVSTVNADTYYDSGMSITLPIGKWEVGYSVFAFLDWVAGSLTSCAGNVVITDSSNNVVSGSMSGLYLNRMTAATDEIGTQISQETEINVTTPTTYKIRIRASQASTAMAFALVATNISSGLTSPDVTNKMWAERKQ